MLSDYLFDVRGSCGYLLLIDGGLDDLGLHVVAADDVIVDVNLYEAVWLVGGLVDFLIGQHYAGVPDDISDLGAAAGGLACRWLLLLRGCPRRSEFLNGGAFSMLHPISRPLAFLLLVRVEILLLLFRGSGVCLCCACLGQVSLRLSV